MRIEQVRLDTSGLAVRPGRGVHRPRHRRLRPFLTAALSAYLFLFACFIPALHTCEPFSGASPADAAGLELSSPDHSHPQAGHDDDACCFACRLNSASGGVVPPACSESAAPAPVLRWSEPRDTEHLEPTFLLDLFPRGPPA